MAITGTVAGTTDLPAQRTSIAFVCIYIFFFASSWGPVAWVVTGELFPLKARAKCLSMTTVGFSDNSVPSTLLTQASGVQLASQLGHRLRNTLHGRRKGRQPAQQSVLRLGNFLLPLHCFCVSHVHITKHPLHTTY